MSCYPLFQNEHCSQSSKVTLGEGRGFVNLVATDRNGFLFGNIAIDFEKSGIYICTCVVV